jgi:uncharacterized phage protein (TIGR01671 family)
MGMRENKYRGRRSYDKKWIYGSLLIDNNGDFHILESNIIEKDGHHIHIDSDYPMFFDNDTIGQFTGLRDKNGVEIFEGDVLNIDGEDDLLEVEYSDSLCKFVLTIYSCNMTDFEIISCMDCEVISNIHERSENDDNYM